MFLFANPRYLSTHFFACPAIPQGPGRIRMELFPSQVIDSTCRYSRSTCFNLSNMGFRLSFFPPIFMWSTWTESKTLFSRCMNKHFQIGTLSHPFSIDTFSNCSRSKLVNWVRTHFFREVPRDLQHCPIILDGGFSADGSKSLDILIVVIPIILARLPFLLGFKPILHQLLVLRIQEVWK